MESRDACFNLGIRGVYRGLYRGGTTIVAIKGDTRSLDYSSCGAV